MPFSVPESHSGYKTRLGYHVSLSSPWLCFSDLPCFWWLGEVLVRYFVKCLSMGIYICFLMISWGNVFFFEDYQIVFLIPKAHSTNILSTADVDFDTWRDRCLSGFSTTYSPLTILPFHTVLFRRKSLCTAHT